MTLGEDNVGRLLLELSIDWYVDLVTSQAERPARDSLGAEQWTLILTARRPGPYCAFTYRGELAGIVARAYAGAPSDQ